MVTPEELARLAQRHLANTFGNCIWCDNKYPCDASRLVAEIERLRYVDKDLEQFQGMPGWQIAALLQRQRDEAQAENDRLRAQLAMAREALQRAKAHLSLKNDSINDQYYDNQAALRAVEETLAALEGE